MSKRKIKNIVFFILVTLILIAIDQITKYIAAASLTGADKDIIEGFFYFELVHNRGAAFGILSDSRIFFCIVTIIFAMIILFVNIKLPDEKLYRPLRVTLIILFSGAIGNLIDRIKNGYVIDFIAFDFGKYSFPRFNVADIYVCSAALLLFVLTIFYYNDEQLSAIFKGKDI